MMLPLKIALRFLSSSRAQTILVVIGIAVGVSVQVFVGTLIGSLQSSLVERTVGNSSQVTVTSSTDEVVIADWESLVATVGTIDAVSSISVAADSAAFVSVGSRSAPVVVRGFEFDEADAIYGIRDATYAGFEPSSFGQVMVGKELAEELDIGMGDEFALVLSNGSSETVSVCGFFDLKVASLNRGWLLTTLETSQLFFGFGTGVTSIEMQVRDVFSADEVAAQIVSLLDDPSLKVDNWKAQNEQLLSGLQGQTASSLMIQVFVLASVVIAIASVLAIKVVQKSRQIGILKAMGIKDRGASMIFLFEGLILGAAGSVMGVLLGVGLLLSFVTFATNPDGSPLIDLYVDTTFVIGSGLVAVLAAVLAAVVPARKSSKLSPIEVIRGG